MNLQTLPEEALKEILALTEAKKTLDLREKAQDYFMPFAHHVYENFIEGRHHRVIAEKLEQVAQGKLLEIQKLVEGWDFDTAADRLRDIATQMDMELED